MTPERKLEIIEETRAFYSGHPERFGWDEETNSCVYRKINDEGQAVTCAVGRYIPEQAKYHWAHEAGSSFNLLYVSILNQEAGRLDEIPEFASKEDVSFWCELQDCHDTTATDLLYPTHRAMMKRCNPKIDMSSEGIFYTFNRKLDVLAERVGSNEV